MVRDDGVYRNVFHSSSMLVIILVDTMAISHTKLFVNCVSDISYLNVIRIELSKLPDSILTHPRTFSY